MDLPKLGLEGKSFIPFSGRDSTLSDYGSRISHSLSLIFLLCLGRSIEMKVGHSNYNHPGGNVTIVAGEAKGATTGGSVDISAGDGTSYQGRGGSVSITAGDAFGERPFDGGGGLTMKGGSANGGIGGSITFQSGASTKKDSGAVGKLPSWLYYYSSFRFIHHSLIAHLVTCSLLFERSHCYFRFWT